MSAVLTSTPKNRFSNEDVMRTFDSRNVLQKADNSKPWILVNVLFVTLLATDLAFGQGLVKLCTPKDYVYVVSLVEKSVLVLFCVNSLVLIYSSLVPLFSTRPVVLTNRQMSLLGVNDQSRLFAKNNQTKVSTGKTSPIVMDLSWIFRVKDCSKTSTNVSTPNSSLNSTRYDTIHDSFDKSAVYTRAAIGNETYVEALIRLRRARSCSPFVISPSVVSPEKIRNAVDLRRYLSQTSSSSAILRSVGGGITSDDNLNLSTASSNYVSVADSFRPTSRGSGVVTSRADYSLLIDQKYQVSPTIGIDDPADPLLNVSSATAGGPLSNSAKKYSENASLSATQLHVWLKFDVEPNVLDLLTHNVRLWLSATVFKPIISEITSINAKLSAQRRHDLLIGSANLNSLQHLFSTHQFPTLATLLPYLEITNDQSFLLERLKDLSRDSCLTNYGGNLHKFGAAGGGGLQRLTLSDFDIALHFLCVYLNAKMPSNPLSGSEGSSFTSQYFVVNPAKPKFGRHYLAIYRSSTLADHIQIVYENDTYDVGKGVGNLFKTLLLFFQILHRHFDSRLGQLSLGPSGLNVLWTLNSTNDQ